MGKQATTVLSLPLETPPSNTHVLTNSFSTSLRLEKCTSRNNAGTRSAAETALARSAFTCSALANEIVFKPISGSRSAHQETI